MKRIAILGGTFNPIHNGHLHLARQFASLLEAEQVLFIPTSVPPHKAAPDLAEAEDRVAMCRLACEGMPYEVSDLEICRGGPSYTSETLAALKRRYPGYELCFIVGEDMFLTLDRWREPERIYALATICAAPRSACGLARLEQYAKKIAASGAKTILANIAFLPVSSTMVREAVRDGKDIRGLVPAGVATYIKKKGLYRAVRCNTEQ